MVNPDAAAALMHGDPTYRDDARRLAEANARELLESELGRGPTRAEVDELMGFAPGLRRRAAKAIAADRAARRRRPAAPEIDADGALEILSSGHGGIFD